MDSPADPPAVPAPMRDPVVRTVRRADITESLVLGLRDFQAAPRIGLLIGGFYALGGMAMVLSVTALGVSYLAYPMAAGFALVGPFLAVALYEVSRQLEAGQRPRLCAVIGVVKRRGQIGSMAFVTLFLFILWMYQIRLLMALFLGLNASFATLPQFLAHVLGTAEGLIFLAVGHAVGAALSLILFTLTVVSFPLLLDRDVDFVTAMITSVRAVSRSPAAMLGWAIVIVAVLAVSALPFFVGLVVTLPVLGHTTWHLYRRAVEPLS